MHKQFNIALTLKLYEHTYGDNWVMFCCKLHLNIMSYWQLVYSKIIYWRESFSAETVMYEIDIQLYQ